MPRLSTRFRHEIAPRAVRAVVEQLEARQHLSVTQLGDSTVKFERGQVTVEATKRDDDVIFELSRDSRLLHLNVNGKAMSFTASKVKQVTVWGYRGDDQIVLNEKDAPLINIPAFLYGGRGDDTITGASAKDFILGHQGKDDLAGGLFGEANDYEDGGEGVDTVEGVKEDSAVADEIRRQLATTGTFDPKLVDIPSYIVRDMGLLRNGVGDRIPNNINASGHVVGANRLDDDLDPQTAFVFHAFLRDPTVAGLIDMGTEGDAIGSTSWAWDINNATAGHGIQKVGMTQPNGVRNVQQAVFWDENNIIQNLGFMQAGNSGGRSLNTIAYGMNDTDPVFLYRGVFWNGPEIVGESNGEAFYLPEPGGPMMFLDRIGVAGRAREINNSSIVVGFASNLNHAFRSVRAGNITDLGTVPGTTRSEAFDINDNAAYMIVGTSDEGALTETAWKWTGGRMTALSKPANTRTRALGVNNNEFIVGGTARRVNQQVVRHAALWLPDPNRASNTFVDLAQLTGIDAGRTLELAHAINDSGQIVAEGRLNNNTGDPLSQGNPLHAFLLTPGRLANFGRNARFEGQFLKPVNSVINGAFDPRLSFTVYGGMDYKVTRRTVNLEVLTFDVERNRLPSQGIVDFVFNEPGRRYTTSVTKGTGTFSQRGQAIIVLEDGSVATFPTLFQGETFRSHRRDYIEGTFDAISSRGKPLKQGRSFAFHGTFGPP